jgi:MoaA/NifB/PqqE/SkfB family radical SAM enzyme
MKIKDVKNWATESAKVTLFKELHIAEFWMPQIAGKKNCNLQCKHCYVYADGRPLSSMLSPEAYLNVLRSVMTGIKPFSGKWDIVFPGMEPLLPRNGEYLWPMVAEASRLGARSIGITTNATLMRGKVLERLLDSAVTTVNVSLDGDERRHDAIRGAGMYAVTTDNAMDLCRSKAHKKVITNTTVMSSNCGILSDVARISADIGCDYAAFHPFEIAVNADSGLDSKKNGVQKGFSDLVQAFLADKTGSIVIEFEAGTAGCFFRLFETGILDDFEIVEDETRFRFLRKCIGDKECLVNIVFYPHHFVRTMRIMDDGSLSSCRMIAKHGWRGVGNIAHQSLEGIKQLPETVLAAADIWEEYRSSLSSISRKTIERFIALNNKKGGD